MIPPQAKCMTEPQRRTVNATLNAALDDGVYFQSQNAVREYLDGSLSDDLLRSCSSDIIDCWLSVQAARNRQLLSPSLSDRSQLNTSDLSLEGDDCSEKSDIVAPTFVSDDPPAMISFYCGSANDFRVVSTRPCKGKISYISEAFARRQLQAGQKTRIILNWSPVGEPDWAYTRCELIHPDQLGKCDVALAENHGKQDTEDVEDEQEEEDSSTDPRPNESGGGSEDTTISDLNLEQEKDVLRMAAALNLETAKMLARSKRKASLPSRPSSSSTSEHKRPRKS